MKLSLTEADLILARAKDVVVIIIIKHLWDHEINIFHRTAHGGRVVS